MTQNYFSNFNLKTTKTDKFFSILPQLFREGALVQIDSEHVLAIIGPFLSTLAAENLFNGKERGSGKELHGLENKQYLVENSQAVIEQGLQKFELSIHKFFEPFRGWFVSSEQYLFNVTDIKNKFPEFLANENFDLNMMSFLKQENWLALKRAEYESTYQLILKMIHQGQIEKAVATTTFQNSKCMSYELFVLTLAGLFSNLAANQAIYYYYSEGEGVLGASPEILFEYKNRNLNSMALAGTVKKDVGTNQTHLLENKKLRNEHQIVVEDIKKVLSNYGFVKVAKTEVLELPYLFHLITQLEVLNVKIQSEDLIKALHPTPALGVSPRNFGFHWLNKLLSEQQKSFHGAPMTIKFADHFAKSIVCIRNIQWNKEGLKIVVGGGIVKESNLEEEWLELENKKNAILQSFGVKNL